MVWLCVPVICLLALIYLMSLLAVLNGAGHPESSPQPRASLRTKLIAPFAALALTLGSIVNLFMLPFGKKI